MKRKKSITIGYGDICPKCSKPMECRETIDPKAYYRQFDYCRPCKHIQFDIKVDRWLKKLSLCLANKT